MNKVLNFVRLDFITIKPYITLKNLIIFSIILLIFNISNGSGTTPMSIGMFMALSVLYVSYPFAVGEQNGIDALYPTISIKRSTVVIGRYLFALIFDLLIGILAFAYTFIAITILRREFNPLEALTVTLVLFIVFSTIQAIQLPIYFKLGYAKAKLMAYLPFMIIPLVVFVANHLLGDAFINQVTDFFEWIVINPLIATALGLVIWLGIMIISYQTALSFYIKRDF